MGILGDVQAELLSSNADLSTILLKLRFLASRLGSDALAEWVKYEAEGYPAEAEVPDYRVVGVTYKGTWSGPFNSGMNNAPVPSYLIKEHAGEDWVNYKFRASIASVEDLAKAEGGTLHINASNLILLLQGKVYPDLVCNAVSGQISAVAMREIKQAVRSRILELTLELEKRVPEVAEVTLQQRVDHAVATSAAVTQIFNQTVYGNINHVSAHDQAQVSLAVLAGDMVSMVSELVRAGVPSEAAEEVAKIVAAEQPKGIDAPLGSRASAWLRKNAPKAATGAWKIGSSVATSVLTEAAMKYWGLKP